MRTLVIVPTYVEAENIAEVLRRVRAAVPEVDVLVVDDNSPDGTADARRAAAAELGQVDVLRRPAKSGLGSAYRAGFAIGLDRGYDVLVQMDADLSHDPAALPSLLAACRRRRRRRDRLALRPRRRDPALALVPPGAVVRREPLRLLRARAPTSATPRRATARTGPTSLKAIEFETTRAKGYGFQIETQYRVWRWGGQIVETPIVFTDRMRGYSKMTWGIFAEELLLVTWWGVRDRLHRLRRRLRSR